MSQTPSDERGGGPESPPDDQHGSHRHSKRRRRRSTIHFDLTDTADRSFDRIIETLLITLLAFAPAAVGGVQAWSELVICILAAAMMIVWCLKLISRPDVPVVRSWTYLPIALFLLITLAQVIPLPMSMVQVISPQTAELKRTLLSPLPESAQFLQRITLSFYPEATWQNLRMLLAVSAVYVVALNTIRQQAQIERLLTAITIIGASIAMIAFAHLLTGAKQIYWSFGQLPTGWPIAPFINRNHFGQFMNASLGAALGLLLVRVEQIIPSRHRDSVQDEQPLPHIPPAVWAIGAGVAVLALGAFMSLSRGTILSLLAAGCVATIVSQRRGMGRRIWIAAPIAWAVVLLTVLFGFDLIIGRFTSAMDDASVRTVAGRFTIVKDVIAAWKQFPILGTGMGSFETTYPMFDTSAVLEVATHAENEFAQVLMEAGAVGLALVIAFLTIISQKYLRCLRSAPSLMASIVVGLGFSFMAVIAQSFTDFGQHAPGNAMMTAVICALVVTLAEASGRTTASEPRSQPARMPLRLAAPVVVAIVAFMVLGQAWDAAGAESARFQARKIDARLSSNDWRGESSDYIALIKSSAAAAEARRGDVKYRYWLAFYRWQTISPSRDEAGQLTLNPDQLRWAEQITQDLFNAAPLCPTYGPVYLLAGQIEKNILQREARGSALIQAAFRLSRTDPAANFEAGLLDARDGHWEPAMAKLRHAAALEGRYLFEGVDALARDLNRTDLALELAGDEVRAVRRIAAIVEKGNDTAAVETVNRRLAALIATRAARPDATADELVDAARSATSEKNHTGAIAQYRRALQLMPGRGGWHLELARVLAAEGHTTEAIEEAKIAARLNAGGAQDFIVDLRLRAATSPSQ